MKRHWLRGLLLGVSMALLLAGGVAVGASLGVAVDQVCFQCWAGVQTATAPDEYLLELTISGLDTQYEKCYSLDTPAGWLMVPFCYGLALEPTHTEMLWAPCEQPTKTALAESGGEVELANNISDYYGEWTFTAWQEDINSAVVAGPVSTTVLFAEDCEEAMREEFVPEPGSMLLLGSGLAGLAGYATLRWRTRE